MMALILREPFWAVVVAIIVGGTGVLTTGVLPLSAAAVGNESSSKSSVPSDMSEHSNSLSKSLAKM